MIDAMKNGWCSISFQTKENENNEKLLVSASYLTNAPEDIMHFCEEYLSNGTASVWFDEEGSFATIVATPDDVYAIVSGDGDQLVVLDYNPKDFVRKWLTDLLAFQSEVVAFRTDYEDLSEKERLSIEREFSCRVKKALNKMDGKGEEDACDKEGCDLGVDCNRCNLRGMCNSYAAFMFRRGVEVGLSGKEG